MTKNNAYKKNTAGKYAYRTKKQNARRVRREGKAVAKANA